MSSLTKRKDLMRDTSQAAILGLSLGLATLSATFAHFHIPPNQPKKTTPALKIACELNFCPFIPEVKPVKRPKSAQKKITRGTGHIWNGKISVYSRKGCLGCSKTLTMANGEPLDDNRLTIAFNRAPLNAKVRLTNQTNGKSIIARVTDRGGFERYGRIADLTIATAMAIGAKTDTSTIKIELVK